MLAIAHLLENGCDLYFTHTQSNSHLCGKQFLLDGNKERERNKIIFSRKINHLEIILFSSTLVSE